MLIKSVLSRLSGAASFGRGKAQVDPAARTAVEALATGSTPAAAPGSQLRDILAQYDVTKISPQGFSDLLQRLYQSGLLADKDYQDLSMIRLDLDRDGVSPNEQVNLVETYTKKLKSLEQDSKEMEEKLGTAGVRAMDATLRRRLDWLQKFAALHASPDAATINALA
jgi:hypothetical protein